jgi:hypothetical protein
MASRLADTQNWLYTSAPSDFNGSQEPFFIPTKPLLFPLKFKKQRLNDSIPTMYGIIAENELLLLLIL